MKPPFGVVRSVTGILLSSLTVMPSAAQDILLEKGAASAAANDAPSSGSGRGHRDHFSRWTYPSLDELPPDARVHTVVTGDTLWAVAESYLGDPYLWPQIWEVNRYILDPHWIYPGDPLVIPQPMLISEDSVPVEPAVDLSSMSAPVPVATRYDVYCAPYIVAKDVPPPKAKKSKSGQKKAEGLPLEPTFEQAEALLHGGGASSASLELAQYDAFSQVNDEDWVGFASGSAADSTSKPQKAAKAPKAEKAPKPAKTPKPAKVKEPELSHFDKLLMAAPQIMRPGATTKAGLGEGDSAYINRGERDGVKAGDEFLVVRTERDVMRPGTFDVVGVAMQMLGVVRVICTQERTATVMVTSSCESIDVGSLIRSFEPIPIPLASEFTPTPAHCEKPAKRPTGQIVYAKNSKHNLGEEDLINIDLGGNAGLVPGDFLTIFRDSDIDRALPESVLGDAVVLFVEPTTATAKVMYSHIDSTIGDRVRLR